MMTNRNLQAHTAKTSEFFPIDPKNFVPSLIEQGLSRGLLSEEAADRVRAGVLDLLGTTIVEISNGKSTSVKQETAQKLLENIFFHIEAVLLTQSSPVSALALLEKENIVKIYHRGVGMASRAYDSACECWHRMQKNLRADMDIAYRSFVLYELSAYLGNYNYRYEPTLSLEVHLPHLGIDGRFRGIHALLSLLSEIEKQS